MSCPLQNSLIPVTTLTTKQDVEFPFRSRAFRPAALRTRAYRAAAEEQLQAEVQESRGWRSKHKHHSTTRRSPSRQATISCPCAREHKAPKAPDHTRSCEFCHVTETPKWRSGPSGRRTLCNVCGLLYAKREEKARSFLLEREFGCDSVSDSVSDASSWSTKVSTEDFHSAGLR
ncbi:hypothetical protein QL093DRAFT_2436551 [Fusarium oxysporum]|nr:hypothetical protein QL093DRAFT_2436551 [Fusarium oxysporum]